MSLFMDSDSVAPRLLAVALVGVLCFAAGWKTNGWRQEASLADLKKNWSAAVARTANEHARKLAAANVRGDELTLQLAERESALNTLEQEKNNEIARLVTGRRCLDAAVVGVLNRDRAGGSSTRVVSQAAGGAVRADGPAAARADDRPEAERYATDADVAGWIGTCQTRYDACRGRLDAIRRFYGAPTSDGDPTRE